MTDNQIRAWTWRGLTLLTIVIWTVIILYWAL